MSTRLTNAIREKITEDLLSRTGYKEREKAIAEKKLALGNRLASLVYTKEEKRRMEKFPVSFFSRTTYIKVRLGGAIAQYQTDERSVSFSHRGQYSGPIVLDLPAEHPISVEHNQLCNETEDLAKSTRELGAKIAAVLSSCTTVEKLISLWPEVKDVARKHCTVATKELCLIPDSLNRELQLPPEKESDAR